MRIVLALPPVPPVIDLNAIIYAFIELFMFILNQGVPFHFHGAGFAETAVGRKRWFFYKPGDQPDFDPDKSTVQWFFEQYASLPPNRRPMECILDPLDVIYFPDRWWHATLNVDTVVFISTFLSST